MKLVKFLKGDLSQNISFNIEKNSQKSKYFKFFDYIFSSDILYFNFIEYFLEVNYIYPTTNLLSFFTVKKANILKSNGIYTKNPVSFEYKVIKIINNLKDNISYSSEDNINKNSIKLDISTNINTSIEIDIKSFAKNELVKRIDFSNNSNLVYYNRIKNYININFLETNTYNLKISTNNYSIDINFKIKPYKNLWYGKI